MHAPRQHPVSVAQARGLLEQTGAPYGVTAASGVLDMSRRPGNDHLTPRELVILKSTKVAHR
jgi:hypothetical protein